MATLGVESPNRTPLRAILHWNVYVPGVAGVVKVVLNASFAFWTVEAAAIEGMPKLFVPAETML